MSEDSAQQIETQKLVELEDGKVVTRTLHDQLVVAAMMLRAGVLPAGITNRAQAWVLLQAGAENGLGPMSASRWLYIQSKSNRVEWTAEGALAKARSSGLLDYARERYEGRYPEDDFAAVFEMKRRDQAEPVVVRFSVADAKRAKLWHKPTPKGNDSVWVTWDREMLLATAQRRCVRKAVPECLGGLAIRGELRGEEAIQRGEEIVDVAATTAPDTPEPPPVPVVPPADPLLADVVETVEPPGPEPPREATLEALVAEATKAAGDDDQAARDLHRKLAEVHDRDGLEAAAKWLREHPVFGAPVQGSLLG